MMNVYVNRSNLAIIIVTYNPSKSLTLLLRKLCDLSFYVVIVDNGSKDKVNLTTALQALREESVTFISLSHNRGVACALNVGINDCLKVSPTWIMTFDQDSLPIDDFLFYYNSVIESVGQYKIGLISSRYSDSKNKVLEKKEEPRWKKTYSLITSGMLHNVKAIIETGMYNEALFIDSVDFDYVLRVAQRGFDTYLLENRILIHELGNPKVAKVLWFYVSSTNHSALRRYYQARNNIYLFRKYLKGYPVYILKRNYSFLVYILRMVVVDDDRWNKIRMTIRGLKDGFKL